MLSRCYRDMWFAISLYMVFALSMSQDLSSKRFCMDFWCLFSREGFTSSNHKDLLAAFLASEPRFTKAPCPWRKRGWSGKITTSHIFPPLPPRPFRSSRRSSWGNVCAHYRVNNTTWRSEASQVLLSSLLAEIARPHQIKPSNSQQSINRYK